ncbi:MAG: hypothetical protein H8D23_00560 [Candidatus Brocadiales bacterium]|nr:hypothetical protein [Candidatus Brocadiales bacterium]
MLPKNGRREIIVKGVLYHYVVKDPDHLSPFRIIIRNSETEKVDTNHVNESNSQIKPSYIEQLIKKAA